MWRERRKRRLTAGVGGRDGRSGGEPGDGEREEDGGEAHGVGERRGLEERRSGGSLKRERVLVEVKRAGGRAGVVF